MAEFAYWLRGRTNPDPETAALRAFADARADWPWWTDQLRDYLSTIQTANPANREDLISAVSANHGRWQAERSQSAGFLSTLSKHMGSVFLGLFG